MYEEKQIDKIRYPKIEKSQIMHDVCTQTDIFSDKPLHNVASQQKYDEDSQPTTTHKNIVNRKSKCTEIVEFSQNISFNSSNMKKLNPISLIF